jgi:ABC-type dipeptide/oligopeptide/nickel transport system ATPase subunit
MADTLDELRLDYRLLLDRSIAIYGASGTGKSAIIVDMLWHLNRHADQILVFCPTDPSNKTYSCGVVPAPLIHYEFDIELLERIWARQEMMAAVYARANSPEILESLYSKLGLTSVNSMIQRVRESKRDHIEEIKDTYFEKNAQKAKINKIEEKYKELLALIYKKFIGDNVHRLSGVQLSSEEQFALKYLNFNPRLVLIFDDCASDIKKYEKKEVVRKLFYQARHVKITLIIACQDDTDIASSLRKNAFISVFTSDICANAFFGRKSNDFPRELAKRVDVVSMQLRWKPPDFEKLVYLRQENKLYKFVAELHDNFCFGSSPLRNFCSNIERNGTNMDKNNPFYGEFC